MTNKYYLITLLTVVSLFLTNSCTNKNNAISVETSRECVIDTVTVAETDSVRDDAVIQHIIDSIQSKEIITRQDIDFVKEHFIWDGDWAWCVNMENKLRYDSLDIMRKKLYKNQKTSELAMLFEEE